MRNQQRERETSRRGIRVKKKLRLEQLEQRMLLTAYIWNTDSNGSWHEPTNWVDEGGNPGVPGASDQVTIDRGAIDVVVSVESSARVESLLAREHLVVTGAELQVDGIAEIESLHLQNDVQLGELDLNGAATVLGQLTWDGGRINPVDLTIAEGGSIEIHTSLPKEFAGSLDNDGTVNQSVPFSTPSSGVLITNRSTGVWNTSTDLNAETNRTVTFVNEGLFRKSGSGDARFHGSGTRFNHIAGSRVEVEGGTLFLPLSGTRFEPSTGAEFVIAEGAVLDLTSGDAALSGTYTGTGAGRIQLSGGRIDATPDGDTTFDFVEGLFHWIGGSIATDTVGGDGIINLGHMTWSGSDTSQLFGQEFHNHGTIVQTGDGDIQFASSGFGTWFHNDAGALFENRGDGGIVSGRVYNDSVFRNTAGNSEYNTDFRALTGSSIEVVAGVARLTKGGEFSTSQISVDSGAELEIENANSGNYKFLDGATLTGVGEGTVELIDGRFESVESNAVLDFASGMLQWTGGEFFRDITSAGELTIIGDGGQLFGNGFTNTGTVIQLPGSVVEASSIGITNDTSGLWELQEDAVIAAGSTLSTQKFFNRGVLRKTGAGVATIEEGLSHQGGTTEILQGTLSADHRRAAKGTGGHIVLADDTLLEIIGELDSTGRYTAEGNGKISIIGELSGGLTIDFPVGMTTLSVPNADDTHEVTNDGWLQIIGNGQQQQFGTFVNNGTFIQTAGTEIQFRNYSQPKNTGLWKIEEDAFISFHSFDGLAANFQNFGTIRKSGASTTSTIGFGGGALPTFNQSGIIDVQSGTLNISSEPISQLDINDATLHGGTWRVGSDATLLFTSSDDSVPPIQTSHANVSLLGPNANFPNIDSIEVNGGGLSLSGDREFVTVGSLTNGVERNVIRMTDRIPVTDGRFRGVAVGGGRMITHARNQRIDGEPIFRVRDLNGVEIAAPIVQPGGFVNVSGIDLTSVEVNVGGTSVPAGTLLFVHGDESPATLYAINVDTGAVITTVSIADIGTGQLGVALHPTRGTVYLLGNDGTVNEIDPSDGSTVNSFPVRPTGSPSFSSGSAGGSRYRWQRKSVGDRITTVDSGAFADRRLRD